MEGRGVVREKFEPVRQQVVRATVAEWLRRLTRNQIPFGSAGSNPAGCVEFWGPRERVLCGVRKKSNGSAVRLAEWSKA